MVLAGPADRLQKPLVFRLSGMTCADCAAQFERSLASLEGVERVRLNYGAAKLEVWGSVSPLEILRHADQSGYEAVRVGATGKPARPFWGRTLRAWLTFLSGAALAGAASFPWWSAGVHPGLPRLLLIAAILLAGAHPFRSAFHALRRGTLEMNVLMSVATVGAVVIGEWVEAAAVIFLFSLGELLAAKGLDRARRPVAQLLSLTPDQTTVVREGGEAVIPTVQVSDGDVCVVQPGQRIPVDGRVLEGESLVDEAQVTGESLPVEKGPGSPLLAGSTNGDGLLRMVASRPAAESLLARLIALVEEAQGRKAPSERLVDHFARVYTPAAAVLALLVATLPPLVLGEAFAPWIYRGLALLVLSCPCALVIAVPVAVVSAISHAARVGMLVKGGAELEALARVDTVVFDKTGTLTKGRLSVTDIVPLAGRDPNGILATAAGVEWGSEHPIGRAIVAMAQRMELDVPVVREAANRAGLGAAGVVGTATCRVGSLRYLEREGVDVSRVWERVRALEQDGKTVVALAENGHLAGLIALEDSPREEGQRAVRRLKLMRGIDKVYMFTGDSREAARALADRVGVDEVWAELLPQEKVRLVEAWQKEGRRVAVVGDGVHDIPALALAHAGIAVGAARSETAFETADVAFLSDDLARLPHALALARRTVRIIRQNVALAIAVKAAALSLLAAGELTLGMAIAGEVGASLFVTFNGLRLLRRVRVPAGKDGTRERVPAEGGGGLIASPGPGVYNRGKRRDSRDGDPYREGSG